MKQSLQLKLSQQLAMTPQLQQAIKLLQLSTLDLQQEIQEALENNPMLEMGEDAEEANNDQASTETPENAAETPELNGADNNNEINQLDDWSESITNDLPVDSQWEDGYQSSPIGNSPPTEGSNLDFDPRNTSTESLHEHLLWQFNLTRFSDIDRLIGLAILDATDEQGRLTASRDDIWHSFEADMEIDFDEVVAVLHRLQQFDPPGVCSANLQECLMIQLNQLSKDTPYLSEAKNVVTTHIALLGSRDYSQLMRRSRLKEKELKNVLDLIKTLNPNPAALIAISDTEYVVPDVYVSKKNSRWLVELNLDVAPKLRINTSYAGLVKRADNSADNVFLKDNLQEARWFLKSLQSRNETLMKVATKIVEHQRGFLDYGEEAMKPLVLHDIAEAVEMHESTISRVTTQKYMHTPRGIFELKYFFSSHVSTTAGGERSSTAIRALIKKLVAAENPSKPLSDSKITGLLSEQGIKVARRTIAKYREALSIPPSNERKQLM
jgi:RNA polymerase sigma-54 factor